MQSVELPVTFSSAQTICVTLLYKLTCTVKLLATQRTNFLGLFDPSGVVIVINWQL
jgi:hypothetical protein